MRPSTQAEVDHVELRTLRARCAQLVIEAAKNQEVVSALREELDARDSTYDEVVRRLRTENDELRRENRKLQRELGAGRLSLATGEGGALAVADDVAGAVSVAGDGRERTMAVRRTWWERLCAQVRVWWLR